MNTEMLYELYEITEKNDAPDLATVGMPMLLKPRRCVSLLAVTGRSWPPPSLTRRHLPPPWLLAWRRMRPPKRKRKENNKKAPNQGAFSSIFSC